MIKVLLGDYNEHLGRSIATHLAKEPEINLLEYINHPEKLDDRIQAVEPDVLVMDFMWPKAEGIQILEKLFNNYQDLKVLVMSSFGDDEFVEQLANLGVAYYLMKPFNLDCLVERIRYVDQLAAASQSFLQYAYNRQSLEEMLAKYLNQMGIFSNLKGYYYLIDAIIMITLNKTWLDRRITSKLYPEIARYHGTTPQKVERAIRYAIDTAWTRGNLKTLNQFFPHTIDAERGKPSNSAFIAKMADIINYNLLAQ